MHYFASLSIHRLTLSDVPPLPPLFHVRIRLVALRFFRDVPQTTIVIQDSFQSDELWGNDKVLVTVGFPKVCEYYQDFQNFWTSSNPHTISLFLAGFLNPLCLLLGLTIVNFDRRVEQLSFSFVN